MKAETPSVPSSEPSTREPAGSGASRTLEGVGLHSGAECRVTLTRRVGPVVVSAGGAGVALADLAVRRVDHGVCVEGTAGGVPFRIDSVEHLFAALAGLGVRRGVAVSVEGGEVPLLDGAAVAFAEALRDLGATPQPPRLAVTRADELRVGDSTYTFAVGDSPSVAVVVDFPACRIGVQMATWDGTPKAFQRDIAWARTFGFRKDGAALAAAGRARGVNPETVMVLEDDGSVAPPAAPARPGEFARHKLLDLVGDAYVFGGPPRGTLHATRPGHGATHRAFALALEQRIVERI